MSTGILNESFADYLASDAVRAGQLDDLRPRPLIFFKRWIQRTMPPPKDTEALQFGRAFHCLALEGPKVFAERYVVIPDDAPEDLRRFRCAAKPSQKTCDSISWWDGFEKERGSREIIARESVDLAERMVDAVREKPAAAELLNCGTPEVTFRHQLPGFAVQARVDWFDPKATAGPLLMNVKTIECLDDFDHQYEKFNYYKSDAFYRLVVARVLGVETFVPQCVNLVVEKQEPFECSIRLPDAESLNVGTREVMADLQLLARCYESGVWPGEPNEPRPVSLSEWKLRQSQ
jgi:hypothetical protein